MNKNYLDFMKKRPELFVNVPHGIEIITDEAIISEIEHNLNTTVGILHEDPYIMLIRDAVRFPDGELGTYIRVYHRNTGGVSILVLCEDKVLLLKHFRHSLRNWLWETPRGFGEPGQTIEENAVRELYEEIGVRPLSIEHLGTLDPDAGVIGARINLFVARIAPDSKFIKETAEGIESVELFTKEQLKEAILAGEITDGITLSSLAYAKLKGII